MTNNVVCRIHISNWLNLVRNVAVAYSSLVNLVQGHLPRSKVQIYGLQYPGFYTFIWPIIIYYSAAH